MHQEKQGALQPNMGIFSEKQGSLLPNIDPNGKKCTLQEIGSLSILNNEKDPNN